MLKKCFSEYDQIFHFPEHVVYYKACLEPGTGCCIDDSQMHQYCECLFRNSEHHLEKHIVPRNVTRMKNVKAICNEWTYMTQREFVA